jgi:hypothetical protein
MPPQRKNWIAGATKNKGALRAKAKNAGAINLDGTISKSWIAKQKSSSNPTTRKQANLASTLGKMKKGK